MKPLFIYLGIMAIFFLSPAFAIEQKFLTDYPMPDGYVMDYVLTKEENGSADVLSFLHSSGNRVTLKVGMHSDSSNMGHVFSFEKGTTKESSIGEYSTVFIGADAYTNVVLWQSVPFFFKITYKFDHDYPSDFIDAYLAEFPPKYYDKGSLLTEPEQETLLFTSDFFENPPEYLDMIFNSKNNRDIPCYSNSPVASANFIENILKGSNYPNASVVAAQLLEQCKTQKIVEIPPIALQYDISECRIEFGKILSAENVPFYENDLLQECLIQAYSQEKYLSAGGKSEGYLEKLEARKPLVVELIKKRNQPKQVCEEDEDNNPVNCYTYNDDIESPPEFVDGKYVPGNLSETVEQRVVDTTGVKEVQIFPRDGAIGIAVNDNAATTSESIEVKDGQIYVGSVGVEVYPDEISPLFGEQAILQKVELKSVDSRPVYLIEGARKGRLLFVIPIDIPVHASVNAVTGEKTENVPWWAFLVG